MRYDVLICGYFGFGNLGDEMILQSAVDSLCSVGIKKERICVMTNDAPSTHAEYGVDCIDRWSLSSLVRSARSSRTLLMPGGGLFQDSTSLRSCAYYWGVIRIASFLGCRVVALGQSVGPLKRQVARAAARSALRRADLLYVRDDASLDLLKGMGLDSQTMPDTILGCDIRKVESDSSGCIMLNLRPSDMLDRYMQMARDILKAKCADGRRFVFVAMSPEDEPLARVFSSMSGISIERVVTPRTIQELLTAADGASCAIGMRLHFVEVMHISGIPTAAISYDPKVSSFARAHGVPDLTEPERSVRDVVDELDRCTMKSKGEKSYDLDRIGEGRKRVRDIFRSAVCVV